MAITIALGKRTVSLGAVASLCLFMLGCPKPTEPTVSIVPAAEVERLLAQATSIEPIGEANISEYPNEGGVTVVCQQALRLSGGGLGPTSLVHCCTGSCINDPSQPISNCKTSGCSTGGKTCTALTCSGSCRADVACHSCDNGLMVMW